MNTENKPIKAQCNIEPAELFGKRCVVESSKLSGDGKTLVVVAKNVEKNCRILQVFGLKDEQWVYQSSLSPSDEALPLAGEISISISISDNGNIVALGLPTKLEMTGNQGAVYIFSRLGARWIQQEKMTSFEYQQNAYFGWAVHLNEDGQKLIVSEPGRNDGAGVVYVYRLSRIGKYMLVDTISENTPNTESMFGCSVTASKDFNMVFIGIRSEKTDGKNLGAIAVYENRDVYRYVIKIRALSEADQDFGHVIKTNNSGTVLMAMSKNKKDNTYTAHIMTRLGVVWSRRNRITCKNGVTADLSGDGAAVAIVTAAGTPVKYIRDHQSNTWNQGDDFEISVFLDQSEIQSVSLADDEKRAFVILSLDGFTSFINVSE